MCVFILVSTPGMANKAFDAAIASSTNDGGCEVCLTNPDAALVDDDDDVAAVGTTAKYGSVISPFPGELHTET